MGLHGLTTQTVPGGPNLIKSAGIGNVYYVNSNGGGSTTSGGLTPQSAFTTLDSAIGACTANNGDVIYVMPGHAESTTTANAELFDLDVAGVSVIGLGVGDKRPTFTLGVATATVVMGAAGCRLSNIIVKGDISDLAAGLEVEAAATGCLVDNCLFYDTATNKDMLIAITVAAAAHRLVVEDCQFLITVGGEATECIKFAGACNGAVVRRNLFMGDWKTSGAIDLSTSASAGVAVLDNVISNADASAGLCIKLHASTTGYVARNVAGGAKNNTETIIAAGTFNAENYGNDTAGTTGILTPATLTAWS